jgi:hypothetical protein
MHDTMLHESQKAQTIGIRCDVLYRSRQLDND